MNQETPTPPVDEVLDEELPDLLDAREESKRTPGDRLGFESFKYTERS